MAKKKGFKIPGVSFSAKRALGVTKAKQKFARKTGIPTSKAGMQRKVGKAVTGGGCLLPVLSFVAILAGCISLLIIVL
ncbi:hypothetical protein [Dehalobacter sp. UNSWDHB]|uniref:hypothetical protein n=1 Tax=Dehalobacter sp. UNSWDHB TaxID=1339256 RepID=UPI00068FB389|nr:hypothetical protein [Dehalobacter sp. UNSWDHB]